MAAALGESTQENLDEALVPGDRHGQEAVLGRVTALSLPLQSHPRFLPSHRVTYGMLKVMLALVESGLLPAGGQCPQWTWRGLPPGAPPALPGPGAPLVLAGQALVAPARRGASRGYPAGNAHQPT